VTLIHVAALVVMIWIRARWTEADAAPGKSYQPLCAAH